MNGSERERGNVFFMLFGAVAMLGVLVAGVSTFVQGPLSTTVKVTRASMAEGQIHIAARLAVLDSAEDPGDCDDDGFIEPKGYIEAAPGQPFPAGGGHMPMVGAAQSDPWGTPYGYCAWDMGQINDICPGNRREGPGMHETDLEQQSRPVLAIISAGSDRTFDTECLDYNPSHPDGPDQRLVVTPPGSEDIVFTYTYAEARGASAGLWQLKPGDPTIATIDRDVEIGTGRLRFGTEDLWGGTLGDLNVALACDSPQHVNSMRFNPFENTIEVCKDTPSWGWQAITGGEGGSGGSLSMIPGFPDAINCRYDNSGAWEDLLFYVEATNNDVIYYRTQSNDRRIDFNRDGSFAGTSSMGGLTIECDGKSIADLYEEGNAFNFVGGPGDSLFEGLVALWPLDESDGETAHDIIGGLDGTLVNMDVPDVWGEGMVGGALEFDGSSYVLAPDDQLIHTDQPFTIAFWSYLNGYSQNTWQDVLGLSTAFSDGYKIFYDSSGGDNGINIGARDNYAMLRTTTTTSADMVGVWRHVVVTYDGSGAMSAGSYKVYVDSVPQTLVGASGFNPTVTPNMIGGSRTDAVFDGMLDDVRVYERALSSLEIYRLYNQSQAAPGGGGLWSLHDNGDDIYYTSGNVGIGTASPEAALDVAGGIRLSDDGDACTASKEGTIRFNTAASAFEICRDEDEDWSPLGAGGGNFRGAYVIKTASQSITTFNPAEIEYMEEVIYDTVQYDTDGFWSAGVPTRFTIPDGVSIVRVCHQSSVWESYNGYQIAAIVLNGSVNPYTAAQTRPDGQAWTAQLCTGPVPVEQGDYFVSVAISEDSGQSLHSEHNWMSIEVLQ